MFRTSRYPKLREEDKIYRFVPVSGIYLLYENEQIKYTMSLTFNVTRMTLIGNDDDLYRGRLTPEEPKYIKYISNKSQYTKYSIYRIIKIYK